MSVKGATGSHFWWCLSQSSTILVRLCQSKSFEDQAAGSSSSSNTKYTYRLTGTKLISQVHFNCDSILTFTGSFQQHTVARFMVFCKIIDIFNEKTFTMILSQIRWYMCEIAGPLYINYLCRNEGNFKCLKLWWHLSNINVIQMI